MFRANVFLTAASLLLAAQSNMIQVQAESNGSPTAALISVKASVFELLKGYQKWMPQHPDGVSKATPSDPTSSTSAPPTFLLRMPSIDLYSPSGVSIYHDTNCEKNAAYISALPQSIQSGNAAKTNEVRPTLKEAMGMFAELDRYEAAPQTKKYTLFAVTYPENVKCEAQDEAIQQFKRRADRYSIRIIQIQLHK